MSAVEPNKNENTIIKGMLMMDRPHPRSAFIIPLFSQRDSSIHKTDVSDNVLDYSSQNQTTINENTINVDSDSNAHSKKKREKYTRTWIGKPQKRILIDWVSQHAQNPYPTNEEKMSLCQQTGLSLTQLNTWFVNVRRRDLALSKSYFKGAHLASNSSIAPPSIQQYPQQFWYPQYIYQMQLYGKSIPPNPVISQ